MTNADTRKMVATPNLNDKFFFDYVDQTLPKIVGSELNHEILYFSMNYFSLSPLSSYEA